MSKQTTIIVVFYGMILIPTIEKFKFLNSEMLENLKSAGIGMLSVLLLEFCVRKIIKNSPID